MTDRQRAREAILGLLEERGPGKTICPSDAARAIDETGFRKLMPVVREAAAALVAEGRLEVTQKGKVVDIGNAKGPVRLRTPASS